MNRQPFLTVSVRTRKQRFSGRRFLLRSLPLRRKLATSHAPATTAN